MTLTFRGFFWLTFMLSQGKICTIRDGVYFLLSKDFCGRQAEKRHDQMRRGSAE